MDDILAAAGRERCGVGVAAAFVVKWALESSTLLWRALLTTVLRCSGARVFGLGGISGGTLKNTMRTGRWGQDLNGAAVNTNTTWAVAVSQLRSSAGRDPRQETSWTNGPVWASVENKLATSDSSAPSEAIDGNPNATLASLARIGIVPLVVTQIGCSSFDFTVDSPEASAPAAAAYWGERFELYKHQYVLSRWTFVRGIQKIEARRTCMRRDAFLTPAAQSLSTNSFGTSLI